MTSNEQVYRDALVAIRDRLQLRRKSHEDTQRDNDYAYQNANEALFATGAGFARVSDETPSPHANDSVQRLIADMRVAAQAARTNANEGVAAFVDQWIERLQCLSVETTAPPVELATDTIRALMERHNFRHPIKSDLADLIRETFRMGVDTGRCYSSNHCLKHGPHPPGECPKCDELAEARSIVATTYIPQASRDRRFEQFRAALAARSPNEETQEPDIALDKDGPYCDEHLTDVRAWCVECMARTAERKGSAVETTAQPRVPPRSFDIEGHMGLYPSDEVSAPEKACDHYWHTDGYCVKCEMPQQKASGEQK